MGPVHRRPRPPLGSIPQGGITTRQRLRLDTRLFRIVSVRAHDRAGRFLEIHAEERMD
jgi:head-tail adaptor